MPLNSGKSVEVSFALFMSFIAINRTWGQRDRDGVNHTTTCSLVLESYLIKEPLLVEWTNIGTSSQWSIRPMNSGCVTKMWIWHKLKSLEKLCIFCQLINLVNVWVFMGVKGACWIVASYSSFSLCVVGSSVNSCVLTRQPPCGISRKKNEEFDVTFILLLWHLNVNLRA